MDLFVDSGAPTLYNTMIRKNKKSGVMGASVEDRRFDDFSMLDTVEYKEYRKQYIKFIQKHKDIINVYANLDIINNAEATWKNQLFLESKGLSPVPVFHFGSDFKWLDKYIKKGYKYIAIGGMIPNSFSILKDPLDMMWDKYLTDKKGMPIVKVHGFAVTSARLVHRYPWYSVDSTSWVKYGIYGSVVIPKTRRGKFDYKSAPIVVCLSVRSPQKDLVGRHIQTLSKAEVKNVNKYINDKGFKMGKSIIVKKPLDYKPEKNETSIEKKSKVQLIERVVEKGVSNDNVMRDTLNALYFVDLGKSVPEWPWAFKHKNKGLFA